MSQQIASVASVCALLKNLLEKTNFVLKKTTDVNVFLLLCCSVVVFSSHTDKRSWLDFFFEKVEYSDMY